jgi:lipopolysaccharide/colanic/teichoic acid biosynthesis glycosyltransferase
MKIVGVRPLSQHYFSLYTEEVKAKRIQFKPGLIPPFYVDLPNTLPEIMESEMNYLTAYEKHPFLTDCKYFWKALWNILIKKARSQ